MKWKMQILLLAVLINAIGIGFAHAQLGLIPNADVETDSEPDGEPDSWFKGGTVSWVDDNGPSLPGSKALQINQITGGETDWRSSTAPAVPGGLYRWSFDYKFLSGATGQFRADLRFFDGGDFEGEDAPLFDAGSFDQWQTSTRLFTAPLFDTPGDPDNPLGDNVLDVRFTSNAFAPGNGLVQFDNVIVTLVPEPGTAALGGLLALALCGIIRGRRN